VSRLENQLHDFAPPIPPSGLFWTIPISAESAQIDFDKATASFSLRNLAIPDWGTVRYGTTGGPNIPATVSFVVRWNGVLNRARKRHEAQRWVGEYIQTTATITWSAREDGYRFDSDPARASKSNAAVMGRHRSGAFFS
jgi:hypothetical protein